MDPITSLARRGRQIFHHLVPTLGTRSLLVGVHCCFLHPFFTAIGWWELFGPPRDLRLWMAFLVHDWGYYGMQHMDDAVGQTHPLRGGRIMGRLFGPAWDDFTRLHSRHYARLEGRSPSPLCAADKLATARVPLWLYLLQCRLSGELREYMALARQNEFYTGDDPVEWARRLQAHFVAEAYRLVAPCSPLLSSSGQEGNNPSAPVAKEP